MARKTSRKETTVQRHTKVPPAVKPEAPKAEKGNSGSEKPSPRPLRSSRQRLSSLQKGSKRRLRHRRCVFDDYRKQSNLLRLHRDERRGTGRSGVCAGVATGAPRRRCRRGARSRDGPGPDGRRFGSSAVDRCVEQQPMGFYHSVVRAAAASSLGQTGRRSGDAALGSMRFRIRLPKPAPKRFAPCALGDRRAVDALIDVVRNPTGYFWPRPRAAVIALAKLGGEAAMVELRSWLAIHAKTPSSAKPPKWQRRKVRPPLSDRTF